MATPARDAILDVVVELLDTDGYGAVQLRTVANRARVGLDTIYKLFPTRDDLVIEAVARWMSENGFSALPVPPSGVSVYEGMMPLFRHVFEPWEKHPRMLEAYFRARNLPGGDRLDSFGTAVLRPVSEVAYAGLDQSYVDDVAVIMRSVAYAAIGQFTNGELAITEILPLIDRTLRRLTADNASLAAKRDSPAGRGSS
jgi:TetR/AcrR family transcriptional regulator, cholesterol catabolism regulator